MLMPKTNYRVELESAGPAGGFWFKGGLGHPSFEGNPAGVEALRIATEVHGHNRYACEVPKTMFEAVFNLIFTLFQVSLEQDQVAIPTIGTRCIPGFLSLWFWNEYRRSMRWLAEKRGYPGHSLVIEQYTGCCDRQTVRNCEFIDVVEDMERTRELDQYDAVIFQAVGNPTARRTSDSAVRRIAELAARTGKLVYFDGAYQCVATGGPVPSPLKGVEDKSSNIIWSYSTSKGDQLANLGYSLLLGDPFWVGNFTKVQSVTREGGSLSGYMALEACLRNPAFLRITNAGYDRLYQHLIEVLTPVGMSAFREGSIFADVEIPKGWQTGDRDSFGYALELAKRGMLTYTDRQFDGDGTKLRVNLDGSLDMSHVRGRLTETVDTVNRMFA